MTYTDLLELPDNDVIHVKKADIRPLDEDMYHILDTIGEILQVILNCIKLKWMLDVNGEVHLLQADDRFCSDAKMPHKYMNHTTQKVKAVFNDLL